MARGQDGVAEDVGEVVEVVEAQPPRAKSPASRRMTDEPFVNFIVCSKIVG